MSICAIQISPRCRRYIYKRGVCSECYKYLKENNLLKKDNSNPDWLSEMIRNQDNLDRVERKEENYEDWDELELTQTHS